MKSQHFLGALLMVGATAVGTSGCFATRMVRDDPGTTYAVANVRSIPSLPAAQTVAMAPPVVMTAAAPPEGTLVVEALAVPPPPAAPTMPVRLPDAVAAAGETHMARADVSPPAPAWGPLPCYVSQFTTGDWHARPIFGASAQSSGSRRWGRSTGHSPYAGYGATYGGTYGSTTGSYGGSSGGSSHFSGGGMSSGHFAGGGMSSGHFAGGH